jgi:hypothetical protein
MGNEVVGLHQMFSNANGGQDNLIPTVWLVITNGLVTYIQKGRSFKKSLLIALLFFRQCVQFA